LPVFSGLSSSFWPSLTAEKCANGAVPGIPRDYRAAIGAESVQACAAHAAKTRSGSALSSAPGTQDHRAFAQRAELDAAFSAIDVSGGILLFAVGTEKILL